MMATVPHVTSGSGLRKFQADGFLFDRVYYVEDAGMNEMTMLKLVLNKCNERLLHGLIW